MIVVRKPIGALIALLLACVFGTSHAQTQATAITGGSYTLTWTVPSLNTDGSTPASVSGYNLYSAATMALLQALPLSINGGTPTVNGTTLNAPNLTTYTVNAAPAGIIWWAVTAWFCTTATCTESVQSAPVMVTVSDAAKTPAPPSNLK